MFGQALKRKDQLASSKIQTLIGEGTQIKGEIQSNGVVRIDGLLEGTVQHTGELIVGPTGRILANVSADTLAVAGEIRGDVTVTGKLELFSSARLYGEIRCSQLIVHDGATFHGRSLMAADLADRKEIVAEVAPKELLSP